MNEKNEKSDKDALNVLLSVLSTLPQWEEADKELVDSLQNEFKETVERLWECRVADRERQAAINELRVARQSVSKHVRDGRYSALSAIDGAIARLERECGNLGSLALDLDSRANCLCVRREYVDSLLCAKECISAWSASGSELNRRSIRAILQNIKWRYNSLRFKDPFPKVRIPSRKSKKK